MVVVVLVAVVCCGVAPDFDWGTGSASVPVGRYISWLACCQDQFSVKD